MNRHQSGAFSRPFTFDRVVRLLISVAAIGVAVWLVGLLKSVLLPFLVAWLIAYLLEPFVQYNKRLLRVRNRWLPISVTLFECVLILCTVAVFVMPSVVSEMHQVASFVRHYSETGTDIPFVPASLHEYLRDNIDFETISRHLTRQDIKTILNAAGSFISGGYNVVMSVLNWFIMVLYVVFIMIDYERLLAGFKRMVPPRYRGVTFRIADDIKSSMNHYFRGQSLIAFLVGVLFAIGFSIIGLPLAIAFGLFVGLLNLVPYLQLISLIPATILCLVYSVDGTVGFWHIWLESMAVYIVVQAIQDFILTPKIMGKTMGLNPAIILLSLSIWGSLMGFIGLIIALPLTTLLLSYYDIYISNREDGETPDEHKRDEETFKEIVES